MKKNIIFVLALVAVSLLASGISYAQYEKGDKLLNVGIGLNSYYQVGLPLNLSFEKGISDDISLGGEVDYVSSKFGIYGFSAFLVGARGSYHFNKLLQLNTDKADLYAGALLGFVFFSADAGYSGTYASAFQPAIFIGGKYYFARNVGGFLELGSNGMLTNFRLGLAFKVF